MSTDPQGTPGAGQAIQQPPTHQQFLQQQQQLAAAMLFNPGTFPGPHPGVFPPGMEMPHPLMNAQPMHTPSHTGTAVVTPPQPGLASGVPDVSEMFAALQHRIESVESRHDSTSAQLLMQLEGIRAQGGGGGPPGDGSDGMTIMPNPRLARAPELEEAALDAMATLLGVSPTRKDIPDINDPGAVVMKITYNLNDPPAEGAPPRQDPSGHPLLSGHWTSKLGKNDPINKKLIDETIARMHVNSPNVCRQFSKKRIRQAAENRFKTFKRTYEKKIDPAIAVKEAKRTAKLKRNERKKAKANRRVAAIPAFKKKHGTSADGIEAFVIRDGVSSEESTTVEDENIGQRRVFKSRPLKFRASWVVKLMYALDKYGKAGTSQNVPRTRGLLENDGDDRNPSKEVPVSMVSKKWMKTASGIQTCDDPAGFDPELLSISDGELLPVDLKAYNDARAYEADDEDA